MKLYNIYLVGIFILNIFVYKYLHVRNRSLTIAIKFIISLCFSSLTMIITGTVEILRQNYCSNSKIFCGINSSFVEYNILDETVSNLNIYTQIIQHISLGFSQLFGVLASVELAYFTAPRSAKSLFMSLYYFSRIIAEYIVDELMSYLTTTSLKIDFSVSIKIQ